jgi:hypothetical protein
LHGHGKRRTPQLFLPSDRCAQIRHRSLQPAALHSRTGGRSIPQGVFHLRQPNRYEFDLGWKQIPAPSARASPLATYSRSGPDWHKESPP